MSASAPLPPAGLAPARHGRRARAQRGRPRACPARAAGSCGSCRRPSRRRRPCPSRSCTGPRRRRLRRCRASWRARMRRPPTCSARTRRPRRARARCSCRRAAPPAAPAFVRFDVHCRGCVGAAALAGSPRCAHCRTPSRPAARELGACGCRTRGLLSRASCVEALYLFESSARGCRAPLALVHVESPHPFAAAGHDGSRRQA